MLEALFLEIWRNFYVQDSDDEVAVGHELEKTQEEKDQEEV